MTSIRITKRPNPMIETNLWAAILLGLAGASHCMGMCGGMALVLNSGGRQSVWLAVAYHAGRLFGYTLVGAIVGALVSIAHFANLTLLLRLLAALLLMTIGLQTLGVWSLTQSLERWGGLAWTWIKPVITAFMPPAHVGHAAVLGAFWGFMPCGLVYSALAWTSSVSTNLLEASGLMLLFGLGTLPAMLGTTLAGQQASRILRARRVRQLLGVMLLGLGTWSFWLVIAAAMGQSHHPPDGPRAATEHPHSEHHHSGPLHR